MAKRSRHSSGSASWEQHIKLMNSVNQSKSLESQSSNQSKSYESKPNQQRNPLDLRRPVGSNTSTNVRKCDECGAGNGSGTILVRKNSGRLRNAEFGSKLVRKNSGRNRSKCDQQDDDSLSVRNEIQHLIL